MSPQPPNQRHVLILFSWHVCIHHAVPASGHNALNTQCVLPDDDSEPILGLWFEETISPSKEKVAPPPPPPPPPLETSPRLKSPSKHNPSENGNILAGRKDPELVSCLFNYIY